jgi:acyl transferase domain-containing protein/SAM-dependent methyltransferase/acyl carrier protein
MKRGASDIAIIGVSGKFPDADDVSTFWRNLCEAKESIKTLGDEQLKASGVAEADLRSPAYVKRCSMLRGVDEFDPSFFKISPAEAEVMDPQLRLLLQCAWGAMEDAGYASAEARNVGVFAGAGGMTTSYYSHLVNRCKEFEKTLASPTHLGNDKDFLATYISYRLNLTGPSLTVQTACSTSLVAVHQACLSLLAGECEMALAGGVRVAVPHAQGYCYREGYIFSRSGHVRSFDADADGVVFGSGLGLVVLKKLDQAVADRDQIYAVIKSTSICNDGRDKLSYAASSARGQIRCIKNALDGAEIDASTIGYVEAHGTGTLMGDPEEVKALSAAFKSHTGKVGFCAIGSVKTNIGHLDAAAGIASLIKAALAVRHGIIPPTLNFATPNPRIRFDRTPFCVTRELQEFPSFDAPRRAAVNSLGVGGTNAFVILEQFRPSEPEEVGHHSAIVPLSARTDDQLTESCKRLLDHIVDICSAGQEPRLADIAYTLQVGRACMKHRVAFVVDSLAGLRRALEEFLEDPEAGGSVIRPPAGGNKPSLHDGQHEPETLVGELVLHQRWTELARYWVSGTPVEWPSLYGSQTPNRIGLPTYPFARQRYWIDADADHGSAPIRPDATIHPLLHLNTSTFTTQSYRSDLTLEKSPLAVRTIGTSRGGFVPVLAYAEMMHAAMRDAMGSNPSVLSMTALQWPSPLAGHGGSSVAITLAPVDPQQVRVEISIAEPREGTILCHGSLGVSVSSHPGRLDLVALRGRLHEADADTLTAVRKFASFSHSRECALEHLYRGHDELLVSIGMPAGFADHSDAYHFHPALVAGLFEIAMGVACYGATTVEDLPRAASLESLELWARCQSNMHMWVRPSAGHLNARRDSSNSLCVDIDLIGNLGDVCARLTNLVLVGRNVPARLEQSSARVETPLAGERAWDGLSFLSDWEEDAGAVVPSVAPGKTVLVVCPPSAYGFDESLRKHHEGFGDRHLHLVRLTDETRQVSQWEWTCAIGEPDGFSQCLRSIDRVDAVYFLAFDDQQKRCRSTEDLATCHELFEIQLLRLVKTLKKEKKVGSEIHTYLLTSDQYSAGSGSGSIAGGGIAGIGYSLAQGNYQFLVRNIDISSADLARSDAHQDLLDLILAEGASSRGEPLRIAYGRRFRQTFHKLHWAVPHRQPFRQGGVYAILGGTGTVGRIFTRYLIDRYDAIIAWVGRTDPDSDKIRDALGAFSGEKVAYFQADATSSESMDSAISRIHQTYSTISGAFFSGQVIDYESSLEQTTEEAFRSILQVKSLGSWNFYRSLEKVRPDFVCYFSSGQTYSFSGAAKLSSYASAITFADRLVQSIQAEPSVPVGIINWGFWRSTVKSITGTTKGVSSDSIAGLDDHEGFEFCEKFLNELQCGRVGQALCMRVPEQIQPLMRRGENESFTVLGSGAVDVDVVRLDEQWIEIPQEHIERLRKSQQKSDLDRWLLRRLLCILSGLFSAGVQQLPLGIGRLMQKAGLLAKHEPFVRVCLELLHEEGCIRLVDGVVEAWDVQVDDTLESAWAQKKAQLLEDPDHAAMTELVDDCLNRLPEVLRGEVLATDVIFPNASMHKVEGVYKHNILSDTFNELLANSVAAYVEQCLQTDPSARIRILEIGAGTGGTSAVLFKKLRPFSGHIDEYCYTDLSKAFLFHAEENYLPDNPYIRCMRLDISQPIRPQGFDVGTYDVVLSTNCLHATDNIRRTLANAKAALRRDGLLIINEISSLTLYNHLTFGLLDGWWLFEDPELRIPGCPGLYLEQWQRVLSEEGFHSLVFPAPDVRALGQQVVAAHSNGVVRQYHAIRATTKPPAGKVSGTAPDASPATDAGRAGSVTHSSEMVRRFAEQKIVECLSRTLKIGGSDIDSHMAFSDYGLDSILGVGFVDQVNKALSITLNTAIIFDFPSVERLTDHVLDSRADQVHSLMSLAEPAPSASKGSVTGGGTTQPGVVASRFVRMEPESPRLSSDRMDEIAVIGMSGMFPKADDTEAFWRNLIDGIDGVQELPGDYLDQRFFSSTREAGRTRCKWGGVLGARDAFDPLFFNLSPREAESMNPHQRLILQEGWNAIEDAGYNPRSLSGTATGVFIGAEPTGYFGETFTGYSDAIVASRLSYHLDLRGPAFVVNTGCSSSGVALHLACASLRSRETNLAVAGGVNACMSQTVHLSLSEIEMLSPSGRCSTFDASGDGTVIAEGVGVVVLKRLVDAIADQDPIYGVICASGTNQDGASNGITAPNGSAQESLIAMVYERFGIDADRISYLEAHGTGTKLGDPIESNALVRAFRKQTSRAGYCAVGSAKSHIGHTAAAAGVIGLIKILLSIKHARLPRLLHFDTLNPLIQFDGSPFHINTQNTDWVSGGEHPRMAALNSFGHSGTNAHLVIREHVASSRVACAPVHDPGAELAFPLSARTLEQLRTRAADLLKVLQAKRAAGSEALPPDELASIAYTLQVGREPMEKRLAIVAGSLDELIARLEQCLSGQNDAEGVFRGELVRGSDELLLFTQDEDMQEAINRWIARRKFSRLMKLWVKGLTVNWSDFYPGPVPRRQNLPTYPFARDRFWVQHHKALHGTSAVAASPEMLHPLVQKNVSDFSAQRYCSRFGGQEFFLRDHVVKGQSMLPAVAYLEMARAAVALALGSAKEGTGIELRNVVWASPIVHREGMDVLIDLAACEDGSVEFQILTANDASESPDEALLHCQGTAIPGASVESRKLDIASLKSAIDGQSIEAARLYPLFSAMGIDFGPAHQGIASLLSGPDQAIAEIRLPGGSTSTLHDYVLHPCILDSALQACIGLIVDLSQVPEQPSLPFALESLKVISACRNEMVAVVSRAVGGRRGDKLVKIDIALCDRIGNVCVEMNGFSARSLSGDSAGLDISLADGVSMKDSGSFDESFYEKLISQIMSKQLSVDDAVELSE